MSSPFPFLPARSTGVLLALLSLVPSTALSTPVPERAEQCAAALGGELSGSGDHLDNSLRFLSWNMFFEDMQGPIAAITALNPPARPVD